MKRLLCLSAATAALASAASAAPLLMEDFSYDDGPLSTASAGSWVVHSGTDAGATALNVVSGQAFINQNDVTSGRADLNRLLTSTIDATTDNTTTIFASFTVNFSALPVAGDSDGSYFAHLKSSAANEFYSRVGANVNGAASGKFRIAVTNESWNVANTIEFPSDLDLNTTYTVVTKLDLATDRTTLWINPVDESSTSVIATDGITFPAASTINAYALRQGTSGTGAPGDALIDSLRVGTTFGDVIPEPASMGLLATAALMFVRRRRND